MPFLSTYIDVRTLNFPASRILIGQFKFPAHQPHVRNISRVSTTNEILFLPLEHKIHIFEVTCNVPFYYISILMTAFLMIFRRFPKILQNCSEGQTNVPEHFPRIFENSRKFPKISEDCRRLSRESRRCFDDTPTNSSTI